MTWISINKSNNHQSQNFQRCYTEIGYVCACVFYRWVKASLYLSLEISILQQSNKQWQDKYVCWFGEFRTILILLSYIRWIWIKPYNLHIPITILKHSTKSTRKGFAQWSAPNSLYEWTHSLYSMRAIFTSFIYCLYFCTLVKCYWANRRGQTHLWRKFPWVSRNIKKTCMLIWYHLITIQ